MPRLLRLFRGRRSFSAFVFVLLAFIVAGPLAVWSQSKSHTPSPVIPTVDAGLGNCSAFFTVVDGEQKPIYNVKISVTFRYGFFNFRKQDLVVYTNSDGQGRFQGLPTAVKKPLVFSFQIGDRQKSVTDDPGVTCTSKETVVLP